MHIHRSNLQGRYDSLIHWLVHWSQIFRKKLDFDGWRSAFYMHVRRGIVPDEQNRMGPVNRLHLWSKTLVKPVLRSFWIHPSILLTLVRDRRWSIWGIPEALRFCGLSDGNRRKFVGSIGIRADHQCNSFFSHHLLGRWGPRVVLPQINGIGQSGVLQSWKELS